jgi:hypothetical protein
VHEHNFVFVFAHIVIELDCLNLKVEDVEEVEILLQRLQVPQPQQVPQLLEALPLERDIELLLRQQLHVVQEAHSQKM